MSVRAEFDKGGNPIFAVGGNFVATSMGGGGTASGKKKKADVNIKLDDDGLAQVGSYKVSPWGDDNDFPSVLQKHLRKSGILRSSIDYKVRLGMGQGLFACKVKGYDNDGAEIIEPIFDASIDKFLRSRMLYRYRLKAYMNMYEYGIAFPTVIPNATKNYISKLVVKDSPFCRFTEMKNGVFDKCLFSGKWPNVVEKSDVDAIDVIDIDATDDEIMAQMKFFERSVFPVNIPTTGNLYYPLPAWDAARQAGWLKITEKIPEYLNAMFDNQMSIKYHVQIPYAYWEKMFPKSEYKDPKERKILIGKELDKIEEALTSTKNAKKALFSHFELNAQGKPEEKWEVKVMDDKFKNDMYLPQSAAGNAEVMTSMSINPSIKGMSMAAGPYAGSAGSGSDIREAFLVDLALSWADRQEVISPIEMACRINFRNEEISIRTRQTVLTTLDTGAGTKKTVS
ncbi:hypothetical protein DF185_19910 [Marinifilum breve]|uniref:Phage portal protein n=1 Tax=Marinifilum breve TaxID=2184082 RepID=A0A2V3ZSS4_9BACT|nr:hypothetical protein [Marinifilum breve]PXX96908.1 hypothetical protein DF185_19910 [Marinifilum breve]